MLSFSLGVGKFLLRLLRWNFKYKITLNAAETLPTNYSHIKPNNTNRHTHREGHMRGKLFTKFMKCKTCDHCCAKRPGQCVWVCRNVQCFLLLNYHITSSALFFLRFAKQTHKQLGHKGRQAQPGGEREKPAVQILLQKELEKRTHPGCHFWCFWWQLPASKKKQLLCIHFFGRMG